MIPRSDPSDRAVAAAATAEYHPFRAPQAPSSTEIGMKAMRTAFTVIVTLLGITAILGAVFADPSRSDQTRLLAALVGVVLMEAAVWRRYNPFLPDQRRFLDLRAEVEGLLDTVRRANSLALEPDSEAELEGAVSAMHESVDRIARVAGRARAHGAPLDLGRPG